MAGQPDSAFFQEAVSSLLTVPASTPAPSCMTQSNPSIEGMLELANAMVEAQAPRPKFDDFADIPASNPFQNAPSPSSLPSEQ